MAEYSLDIIVSVDAPDDETVMRINRELVSALMYLNEAAYKGGATNSAAELWQITDEDEDRTILSV